MQQFVNQAASSLADSKELWGTVQNERLLQADRNGNKQVKLLAKGRLVISRSLSFQVQQGSVGQFFFFICLFIWLLQVLVAARGIFSYGMQTPGCGMWHLAP